MVIFRTVTTCLSAYIQNSKFNFVMQIVNQLISWLFIFQIKSFKENKKSQDN